MKTPGILVFLAVVLSFTACTSEDALLTPGEILPEEPLDPVPEELLPDSGPGVIPEDSLRVSADGTYLIRLPHMLRLGFQSGMFKDESSLNPYRIVSLAQAEQPNEENSQASYRLEEAKVASSGEDAASLFDVEAGTGVLRFARPYALPHLDERQTNNGQQNIRDVYTHSLPQYELLIGKTTALETRSIRAKLMPARLSNSNCGSLPTATPQERVNQWRCGNLQPIYPPGPFPETFPEHISSLPDGLAYEKEKYRLIFNEEFDETEEALENIPPSQRLNFPENFRGWRLRSRLPNWRVTHGACILTDEMDNGHLAIRQADRCGMHIETRGKFEYTYGYVEVKMSLPARVANPNGLSGNSVLSWPRVSRLPGWLGLSKKDKPCSCGAYNVLFY